MKFFKKFQNVIVLLVAALLLRIVLSPFGTLSLDFNTFLSWSSSLNRYGFSSFYQGWSDYLPGYLYFLWILGKINSLGIVPQVLLYKFPAIVADVLTGLLIYKIARQLKNEKTALLSASFYLFNPAIMANSSLWGQVDSLTSLFSLLSLYLINSLPFTSAVTLAIGTLIKPQAGFLAPLFFLLMLFKFQWKPLKIALYILTSASVFVLGFLPFTLDRPLFQFILERLDISLNQYPYTSVNAFNFWSFFGMWRPDSEGLFSARNLGLTVLAGVLIYLFIRLLKTKNSAYFLSALSYLATFHFLTRIHERHLLPVFAPLALSAALVPSAWISYWGLSMVYLANLVYSYNWITHNFFEIYPPVVIKLLAGVSLLMSGLFVFFLVNPARNLLNNLSVTKSKLSKIFGKGKTTAYAFNKSKWFSRYGKILLYLILFFSFISRLAWLDSPKNEYFDEIYHAFTAKLILQADPKAWEWWNPHPEGFAYEWTHPPFAKEMMAGGMYLFGENPLGWRIPAAILGTGVVYLVYLISRQIFKDEGVGLLSAALFSLDGLALVMSRIGMNDTYFLFFVLLSLYFFLKERNFFSAIAFGLAISSKWSAIWAVPIFLAVWLIYHRKIRLSHLWFMVIPPLVYLASYLPLFLTGHEFDIFTGVQKQMWWYHTNLVATHPYTSQWWSWPFLLRPIYLYTSSEIGGWVSRIYAMGNPLIFWYGLYSVVLVAYFAWVERNKKLGLIVFSYLVFFAPWAASPRIMFFYHYLPSLPFLSIAGGYILRRFPRVILPVLGVSLLLFVYFYPHWTGLNIPLWLDKSYYWFSSWR